MVGGEAKNGIRIALRSIYFFDTQKMKRAVFEEHYEKIWDKFVAFYMSLILSRIPLLTHPKDLELRCSESDNNFRGTYV